MSDRHSAFASWGWMLFGGVLPAFAVLLLSGCSIVRSTVDEYRDWRDGQSSGTATNAPVIPPPPAPAVTDAVEYGALQWVYGGFNGSRAIQSGVVISDYRTSANRVDYRFARDLSAWGIDNPSSAAALVCAFVRMGDGTWRGGKFDWVSSNRTSRDLNHLGTRGQTGYKGWTLSGVPNPTRLAFVVVSKDGRWRSNVVDGEWSR